MTKQFSNADLHRLAPELGVAMDGPCPVEKVRKPRTYEEHNAQVAVIVWWHAACRGYNLQEQLLFAIPNGSALGVGKEDWQVRQRIIRGKRLKDEGLRAGTFDLFLSVPRGSFSQLTTCATQRITTWRWCGLYLEMKTATGVVSLDQIQFQKAVETQGYKAVICRSQNEAVNAIIQYLKT